MVPDSEDIDRAQPERGAEPLNNSRLMQHYSAVMTYEDAQISKSQPYASVASYLRSTRVHGATHQAMGCARGMWRRVSFIPFLIHKSFVLAFLHCTR